MTRTAAKIIPLRRGPETIELEDTDAVCELLQRELFRFTSFAEIAAKAGVCDQTVARLAYGETKQPRAQTMVRILKALGWTVLATR